MVARDAGSPTPAPALDPAVPHWFAVYTSVNQEKRVSDRLSDRGIEHFLPLYHAVRRRSDRTVSLNLPLFPGYLFVRIPLVEKLSVLQVPRVVRFVSFQAGPAVIAEDDILSLQRSVEQNLRTEPHPFLKVGQRVRVLSGAFAGREGILVRKSKGPRVVLSIDSIMRSFAVEMQVCDIEPLR